MVEGPAPAAWSEGTAPRAEARIAAVFGRLLGQAAVRPDDNFFALGGHSLLAVQAHRDLQEIFGKGRLAVTDIFRFPSARGLAAHLDAAVAAKPARPATIVSGPQATLPARAVPSTRGAERSVAGTIQARRDLRRRRTREVG